MTDRSGLLLVWGLVIGSAVLWVLLCVTLLK
jgi:hypothetical protein